MLDLVPPDAEPTDPLHEEYLLKVSRELSPIEYQELRKVWFYYQKCLTDVNGFYKKIKLMLRGKK